MTTVFRSHGEAPPSSTRGLHMPPMSGTSTDQLGADARQTTGGLTGPLRVHLLFHPDSEWARDLALHLFSLLNGPSTDWGPRIPVRFGAVGDDGVPTAPTVEDSARSLVVVLV